MIPYSQHQTLEITTLEGGIELVPVIGEYKRDGPATSKVAALILQNPEQEKTIRDFDLQGVRVESANKGLGYLIASELVTRRRTSNERYVKGTRPYIYTAHSEFRQIALQVPSWRAAFEKQSKTHSLTFPQVARFQEILTIQGLDSFQAAVDYALNLYDDVQQGLSIPAILDIQLYNEVPKPVRRDSRQVSQAAAIFGQTPTKTWPLKDIIQRLDFCGPTTVRQSVGFLEKAELIEVNTDHRTHLFTPTEALPDAIERVPAWKSALQKLVTAREVTSEAE